MNVLCDAILRLISPRPSRPAPLDTEADAVRALYFSGATHDIDPGLVERLLWWEGIEAPAAPEQRMRAMHRAA